MKEDNIFFRMNLLMSYTDIDAFTAQKNMGSRLAYFEALEKFIAAVPEMARNLKQLSTEGELSEFLEFIHELQDQLMEIGASSMVWEAEKVAVLAREEERSKCVEESFILASKLNTLQERIREAKLEKPNESDISPVQPVSAIEAGRKDRLQASISPEPFEKIKVLIENFELDDALSMLRSLIDYSYNREIDAILITVYNNLAAFDYDSALWNFQLGLKMVQNMEIEELKSAKKKILAIDDVPDVLNTVKSVLSAQYSVYGVTNHKAALKFLTGNYCDLILLDIEMPDMDGFAMLGIIRRVKTYETTPVLFLTSSVSVENIKKSYALGANDFIRKPIEASILIEKVKKHI